MTSTLLRVVVAGIMTALVSAGPLPQSAMTRFPGPRGSSVSPNGRYAIENRDSDSEPNHELTLKETITGRVLASLPYPRHVDILWSKDGEAVAVNNFEGSDFATCLLFVPRGARVQTDIGRMLLASNPKDRRLNVSDSHHVNIECVAWPDNRRVRLRVIGYGESFPKGFEAIFDYVLGDAFVEVKPK